MTIITMTLNIMTQHKGPYCGTQHNDTQDNDIQHNDTQHNDIQHNDLQHNDSQRKGLICDTQHNNLHYAKYIDTIHHSIYFYAVARLNAIMLSVVVPSVMTKR